MASASTRAAFHVAASNPGVQSPASSPRRDALASLFSVATRRSMSSKDTSDTRMPSDSARAATARASVDLPAPGRPHIVSRHARAISSSASIAAAARTSP